MNEDPILPLAKAIRERNAVLFVGAGVSMSVGLPSWEKLIERMASELGLDGARPRDRFQTLAEYYRIKHGSIGPLRSWMDRHWTVTREKIRESELHRLIVALDFPVIYTTNYDRNLEVAFEIHGRAYVKVANARDVSKARRDVACIVKFHGDFDDDSSLVLTETDYLDRLSFDSPLDVRFRSDALGSTVLFVGYSLSDLNIRLLLHRLWQTWNRSGYEADRPPSYIFMASRDPVEEAVLGRWGISVLTGDNDDPAPGLVSFLSRLAEVVNDQEITLG
ncbi:Sir2 family NAD-dependent protein deacetylase [Mesorhizobium sp. WSM3866]|uniref:SIR2 family NAD-dependent protein deacylase n=1 Tax=Mesorhizobium sp. WSM3866 TaxID=422271 RepID=UPI000BAF440A|nr:SIR2 family protein [Mesorhizobium sp. WSM3866]PBB45599.1 Sir2 family NAD-dependent protein deacetylase [Mesorhizobium sp. WSM3866]